MSNLITIMSVCLLIISLDCLAAVDTTSPNDYHPTPVYVYPTPNAPMPTPSPTNPPLSPHGVPGENEVEIIPPDSAHPHPENSSPTSPAPPNRKTHP
ncbi:MAG: hypothetical protein HWD61_10295 [Parachlamydiaceae bacterium]|nr:MAG: hypothetical protein HWD61_10295 [Parachlamydiaceae bacterium]